MKHLATTMIFSLCMLNAFSQQQFQILIHPGLTQEARCMKAAVGGGYLLASNYKDYYGAKSILLTRFDSHFNIVWNKTIDQTGLTEQVRSFTQDASGKIFIAGNIEDSSAAAIYKSLVIKTDSSGNLIWQKIFNYSNYNNWAYFIYPSPTGSLYVAGETIDEYEGFYHPGMELLIKLNSTGTLQWEYDYPYDWKGPQATGMVPSSDGSLLVSGENTTTSTEQAGLNKFDTAGNRIWGYRYMGGAFTSGLTSTSNGGCALFGYEDPAYGYVYNKNYIMKVDASGSQISRSYYDFSNNIGRLENSQGIQTTDGGFAFAGSSGYYSNSIVLLKVDSNLAPQWSMLYDTNSVKSIASVLQTADGGYAIAATKGNNILIIKTNASGISLCNERTISASGTPQGPVVNGNYTERQTPVFNALSYQPTVGNAGSITDDVVCNHIDSSVNNIITSPLSTTSYCLTQTIALNVAYTIVGTYSAGNVFTAQLSNASGSFASPVTIGSLTSTSAGTIASTIQTSTPPGSHYRIRVVSSNPAVTGTNNNSDIVLFSTLTSSQAAISAGGPTAICKEGKVVLTVATPGLTYQWKKGNSNIAGATLQSYTTSKAATYKCVVSNSCNSLTSNSISVTQNPSPTASVSAAPCSNSAVLVTCTYTPSSGVTFQWTKNSVNISGATNSTYSATSKASYKCIVTITATGCTKLSNAVKVTITCRESDEVANDNKIIIYPNPSSNYFTINTSQLELPCSIYIYDLEGRLVESHKVNGSEMQVGSSLSNGVYFLKITGKNATQQVIKLVKSF